MPDHSPDAPRAQPRNMTCADEYSDFLPNIDYHLLQLARRFQYLGLTCERQTRQTPRGISTFLAVVGQRGLLCMVDITLVVAMQTGGQRRATVDAWLLDACGDVVAPCITKYRLDTACDHGIGEPNAVDTGLTPCMTSIFVMAMAHFDLVQAIDSGPVAK